MSTTIDPTTNRATSAGSQSLDYDAAGNLTYDHLNNVGFTYDADGNVLAANSAASGVTNYVYNALNQRTRTQFPNATFEFVFDPFGRRTSTWNGADGSLHQALIYSDTGPVAFRQAGVTTFQHQDILGTERFRTDASGNTVSGYASLPFGDGYADSGPDWEWHHFAGLDRDSESVTEHAQFRQYASTQGRWMSPDPYDGSMDLGNPQSFNRYAYVENNPLAYTDPSGLNHDTPTDWQPIVVDVAGAALTLGISYGIEKGVEALIGLFSHAKFTGATAKRSGSIWDEQGGYKPVASSPIDILGLPTGGCEFGACGSSLGAGDPPGQFSLSKLIPDDVWTLLRIPRLFSITTHNALHAPPLRVDTGVCSIYGNEPYLGAGLACVCQTAGESQWSEDTRGCLASDQNHGINEFVAHGSCYAGSTLRTGTIPLVTLKNSYMSCKRW